MKLYSRIVGIILTAGLFTSLVCLIVALIVSEDTQEKFVYTFTMIPCLAFLYFMFLHRFGFSLKPKETNYTKFTLILTGCSFILIASIPTWNLLSQIRKEKEYEIMVDRGEYITPTGLVSSLKTKYNKGNMKYIVDLKKSGIVPFEKNFRNFIVLQDEEGFRLKAFELKGYTTYKKDSIGTLESITINSEQDIELDEYIKIKKWDILRTDEKGNPLQ
ncbi:hypothetical protein [Flavobacterium sp. C4GT6]|uniref:hypothetical protein n=1 Tax=Flavobacterium sp. C4GT6 TaxID=3103818 RepID=UPI002ED06984